MKKRKFSIMPLLAAALIFAGTSCSSETESLVAADDSESSTTETETTEGVYEGATLTVSVAATAGASTVTFRSVSSGQAQHYEEAHIDALHIYIFNLTGSATSSDDNFSWYSTFHFKTTVTNSEGETGDDGNTYYPLTDNGDATYSCSIPISSTDYEETVKLVMLANDEPTDELTTSTTLTSFLTSLASASVSDGSNCDLLVGEPTECLGTYSETDVTESGAFPMSATCIPTAGENYETTYNTVKLTVMGGSVEATLVRTMARIDIENTVPNLSITGVWATNTPLSSYLFAQSSLDYPSTAGTGTIYALNYMYPNTSGVFTTALEYDSTVEDPETDNSENTYAHVLYLYEAPAGTSDDDCITIIVTYAVTIGETEYEGRVDIPFATTTKSETDGTTSTEYIDCERNHLYSIQLGEYEEIEELLVTTMFVVDDWTEEDIESTFDPGGTDSTAEDE